MGSQIHKCKRKFTHFVKSHILFLKNYPFSLYFHFGQMHCFIFCKILNIALIILRNMVLIFLILCNRVIASKFGYTFLSMCPNGLLHWGARKPILVFYSFFVLCYCCSLTVVPLFSHCSPLPSHPSLPQSIPTLDPWVIYTCSSTRPFPFFPPLSPSPLPSGPSQLSANL